MKRFTRLWPFELRNDTLLTRALANICPVLVFLHFFVFEPVWDRRADRQTDGRARPILWPVRMAQQCQNRRRLVIISLSSLFVHVWQYSTNTWSTMLSLVGSDWIFRPLDYNHFHFPPTLHVGDYNMDGFPDVITVLSSPTLVAGIASCVQF